jgi:hypothetical protein
VRSERWAAWKVAALLAAAGASAGASYVVAGAAAGAASPRSVASVDTAVRAAMVRRQYPSGDHLVAYVLLSHLCPFSSEPGTQQAVAALRDSLKRFEGHPYAKVSVIGVSIESDLDAGFAFLRDLQRTSRAFDELSIGGGWLNGVVTTLVWREAAAAAATPTVIVVRRRVHAEQYPLIRVDSDSLLVRIRGRPTLIDWVARGTPVPDRPPTLGTSEGMGLTTLAP